jgi:Tol biopolymer transport system component
VGLFDILGTLVINDSATIHIDIGGRTTPGTDFDILRIDGADQVFLTGGLQVSVVNGFQFQNGDQIPVLTVARGGGLDPTPANKFVLGGVSLPVQDGVVLDTLWTDNATGADTLFITATTTATSRPLVFTTLRDGNNEVYLRSADGGTLTNLTNNAADDSDPDWSRDQAKIVFFSTRDGDDDVYVMNTDGTGVTNLTNNTAGDAWVEWSPDNQKIAFASNRDGSVAAECNNLACFDIYTMNADGSGTVRLTTTASNDEKQPTWSADGTKVAYYTSRHGVWQIYTINADGTGETRITNTASNEYFPDWSPDGSKIAFTSDRNGNNEIYVMNADGTGATRLTTNTANDFQPVWMPGGTQLVFTSDRANPGVQAELWVMNADGTNPVQLTSQQGQLAGPRPALVTSVTIIPSDTNIATISGTVQLAAELRDAGNALVGGTAPVWTSSNPAVATVEPTSLDAQSRQAAVVTGVAIGTATITATAPGGAFATATVTVGAIPAGVEATWTGAQSTDWHTAGNWNPTSVPTSTTNVYVPSAPANQPVVAAAAATDSLYVQEGASLTINGGQILGVYGDLDAGYTTIGGAGEVAMAGTGMTVRGRVPNLRVTGSVSAIDSVHTTGGIAITGTGNLDVGAHPIYVGGTFATVSSGTLAMTDGAGVIDVVGDATFDGGATTGLLTAGTLRLRGNLTTGTTANAFDASAGHLTEFFGTGARTIDFGTAASFGDLSIHTLNSTVSATTTNAIVVDGNLTVRDSTASTSPTILDLNAGGGLMVVAGNVTAIGSTTPSTQAGQIQNGTIYIGGQLDATGSGAFQPTLVVFNQTGSSSAQIIPVGANFTYTNLYVTADSATFAGNATIANVLSVQGSGVLRIPAGTITTGSFNTSQQGVLRMTTGSATLDVNGTAAFGGGSTVNQLTGGTIRVSGNIVQTSANSTTSFAAGTGHNVLFDGGSQTVSFQSPGTGLSRFGNVDVTGSASVQPSTNVVIANTLSMVSGTQWTIAGGTTLDIDTNMFLLSGATLSGTGTLDVSGFTSNIARVALAGTISPAGSGSIGTLSVIGHVRVQGQYLWDHNGSNNADRDLIAVTGSYQAGGNLVGNVIGTNNNLTGFVPVTATVAANDGVYADTGILAMTYNQNSIVASYPQ